MKQNVMNPFTWNKQQWKDALMGAVLTAVVFTEAIVVISIFH